MKAKLISKGQFEQFCREAWEKCNKEQFTDFAEKLENLIFAEKDWRDR